MPRGGVNELLKSSDGRRYLATLQKKYKVDLLQPGEKGFQEVYGKQIKKSKEKHERQVEEARAEWHEKKARESFDPTHPRIITKK